MTEKNPTRTGVKAVLIPDDPDTKWLDRKEPGLMYRTYRQDEKTIASFLIACPGCGEWGGVAIGEPQREGGPVWQVTGGSVEDVTTLTLHPSIHCVGCCGWHGYLQNGVFNSV